MNDVATVDTPIRINRVGALGVLDSDRATALIMVITELVQNAIEHAFEPAVFGGAAGCGGGCVTIRAERSARWLDVVVHDNGRGLPEGFSLDASDRLGLQIVRTLVSAELDGSLRMEEVPEGGTDVVLRVPIGRRARLAHMTTHVKGLAPHCGPDCSSGPQYCRSCDQTPVRAFVRALRRLSARRSSSLIPPHTPESCPVFSAQDRHSVVTGQRLQTSFASAIWASAGPLFPTGKNSSGSASRQTALWRQSIRRYS